MEGVGFKFAADFFVCSFNGLKLTHSNCMGICESYKNEHWERCIDMGGVWTVGMCFFSSYCIFPR